MCLCPWKTLCLTFSEGVIAIQKPFFTKPRNYIILGIILLLLLAFGGWFRLRQSAPREGDFISVPAAAGNLVATISASGTEPVQSLNLSFKNPGTVKVVAVEQGQEVKEGQLLLAQDDRDQQAQAASARANLRSARARLEELQLFNTFPLVRIYFSAFSLNALITLYLGINRPLLFRLWFFWK